MPHTIFRFRAPASVRAALRVGGLALVATVALGGCKGDDSGPPKLFEEEGSYEITFYSLDGAGIRPVNANNRSEAFLLNFDASANVAQTAMCAEDETDTPESSLCRLAPNSTSWFCKCYSYAYEEDTMVWKEFAAGDVPPEVTINGAPTPPMGGTDTDTDAGGAEAEGGASDTTTILLAEIADVASTYSIGPLPEGIFGSDGMLSVYQMQRKAPTLFDQVLADPDGRGVCQPCI